MLVSGDLKMDISIGNSTSIDHNRYFLYRLHIIGEKVKDGFEWEIKLYYEFHFFLIMK